MARKKKGNRGAEASSNHEENRQDVVISIESLLQNDDSDDYIRIVEPYLYTFTTYVKRRWIDQRLIDVYTNEFGGYSRSYYEAAIGSGKILVSNQRATSSGYLLKDGDVLSHSVHLHEPAVLVSSENHKNNDGTIVKIVADSNDLLVVDKPSTMAVHPCGSHQHNSLTTILEAQQKSSFNDSVTKSSDNKLYAIHRLDRVTSGLCLLAKSARVAQLWGKSMIMQPLGDRQQQRVHKWYLARVRGKFPLNMNATHDDDSVPRISADDSTNISSGVHTTNEARDESGNVQADVLTIDDRRTQNAFGFWTVHDSMNDVAAFQRPIDYWLQLEQQNNNDDIRWLHLACPTRVAQHKDGLCQAGSFHDLPDEVYIKSVKASQTAFGVVSYSAETDSTLLVCKPSTGRSHQIRLHLRKMGHVIANDDNYGGDMWYGDAPGRQACQVAMLQLSEDEAGLVQHREELLSKISRRDDEGLEEYIAKTCIRCNSNRRDPKVTAKLQFLTEGRGIWLRAMKYQMDGDGGSCFQAELPTWAFL